MTVRTFTPNPAVDETVLVPRLRLDTPLRPTERLRLAGGKGINVARTVLRLGGAVRCHGVVSGETGRWLAEHLHGEGIDEDLVVDRDGTWQTRTTQVIADDEHAVLLYDPGAPMPEPRLREAAERCVGDLEAGDVLVVSGSLPPGDHDATIADLLRRATDAGVTVVVDSSGHGLRLALEASVDVIKVDHEEAAEVTGEDDPAVAATALLAGSRRAVVTSGADGAHVADREEPPQRLVSPTVEARHPAGSGDAFAGALATSLDLRQPWELGLRSAAAAGAANTLTPGAGAFDPETYRGLLPAVDLRPR